MDNSTYNGAGVRVGTPLAGRQVREAVRKVTSPRGEGASAKERAGTVKGRTGSGSTEKGKPEA